MITRRQLKELFKNIAESHKQINSFGWGDVPEILSRQDHIYPLMMVTPSDVINEQGQIKHTYIISVADRLKKDISNQVDVDNDTHQIMSDLIAIFYNIDYLNLSVELPLNITPFKNIDPQDVIGWYGTFNLIVDENYDYCAVPTEPIPFDPDPPFVCAPAFYRVQYEDGELIQEGEIPSGGSVTVNVPVCPESGSVEWQLIDEDDNVLDSGTQPAGVPLTITAPDGLITIKDTDDGVLYVVNINSGGSVNQIINDSTVNINKSDSVLISAQTVKAEGVENYNVADSVITLNNSVATLISTTNVKATDPSTIVAPDAEISLNGVKMKDIPSNTSSNIFVYRQTGTFQVGSKQGVHWRIADGVLNVNKSDGTLISARTLAAEDTDGYDVADSTITNDATTPTYTQSVKATENLVLPSQTINVNTVNEGSINSVGTIEINITDGTNPVTPDDVTISGRTITIEVPTAPTPPLSPPYMAYGLRKLISTYLGNAAVVRRDSDNTTTDIGFSGNDFDVSAFDTFVGAGNGFVRNLYNQAETLATEAFGSTTLGNQPQIVTKGSRKVIQGRGALDANVQLTAGTPVSVFQHNLGFIDSGFAISYVLENVNANLSNHLLYNNTPLSVFRFNSLTNLGLQTAYTSQDNKTVASPTNLRHALLTCNPDKTYKIFLNGTEISSGTMNFAFFTIGVCILSGGAQLAEYMTWNRPLGPSEITTLWTQIQTYYGL
jgi:hypothetical protein